MMRQPARRGRGRAQEMTVKAVAAPVRGWNARDSVANMDPLDAAVLDNWWPSQAGITLRKGSAEHVTDVLDGEDEPIPVETLITYKPETGLQKLFGFAGESLFDFSSGGAVGAAEVTGLGNALWQCQNFATSGGNYLLAVNGLDDMLLYDGTDWAAIDGSSTPAITGVATSDLDNLFSFKERIFYVEKNSLSLWYAAAGAFAGALTKLPLQAVFKKGGYIVAGGNWTVDGGDGIDDLMVVITSEGEVAVFQGTDPGSADTWARVGTFAIGKPISRRCMEGFGSDLLIITTDGVVPASKALSRRRTDAAIAVTDRIQGAMADAVALYASVPGWSLTHYAEASMLLLNVPVAGASQQFAMNTITKAWTRFRAWNALCWAEFNGQLYYGMSGEVRQAWTGTADLDARIDAELVAAFNFFGARGSLKHFTMVQPLIAWDSNPAVMRLGVDTDFDVRAPQSEVSLPQSGQAEWDDANWDAGLWAGDPSLKRAWYSAEGVGHAGAFHLMISSSTARVGLSAYNIAYKPGGVL